MLKIYMKGNKTTYMKNLPEELDFLKKLDNEDKKRFYNMTGLPPTAFRDKH